jgi:hypothetical protein
MAEKANIMLEKGNIIPEKANVENLDPRVKQIFDGMVGDYAGALIASLDLCESPIEQLMMLALNSQKEKYVSLTDEGDIAIIPQAEVNIGADSSGNGKAKESFRVDFLIITKIGGNWRRVIVECDGHEFHEKNKEQAARDKRRGRMLVLEGYIVLNYTGSEIWGNPFKCAREVLGAIFRDKFRDGGGA